MTLRVIFDKYIHTNLGANGIAEYLNTHGYKKKKRQNNTLDAFAPSFIKGVLDNPIYMGKMPYGRRATEKIPGTRNEFHVVKQDEYSQIWICPDLRSQMHYARAFDNRGREITKRVFTFQNDMEGFNSFNLWAETLKRENGKTDVLIGCEPTGHYWFAFAKYVQDHQMMLVMVNPFSVKKIKELDDNSPRMRMHNGRKSGISYSLDISDPHYDRKIADLERRYDEQYGKIEEIETLIAEVQEQIQTIRREQISGDNIYQLLLAFDEIYESANEVEGKIR